MADPVTGVGAWPDTYEPLWKALVSTTGRVAALFGGRIVGQLYPVRLDMFTAAGLPQWEAKPGPVTIDVQLPLAQAVTFGEVMSRVFGATTYLSLSQPSMQGQTVVVSVHVARQDRWPSSWPLPQAAQQEQEQA